MLFSRKLLAAWAVLAISLAGTLLAWQYTARLAETRAKTELDAAADRIVSEIHRRMTAYEQVLHAGTDLFAASGEITRAQWRDFFVHLRIDEHFPGIQGIGYAQRIAPAELALHMRRVRAEGFPAYAVRPEGERDTYTSIVFIEPFGGRNLRAFGYDMFSEPVHREAMQHARDTGDATLSGKVKLVQEAEQDMQPGFLLYVPVYAKVSPRNTAGERRAALRGWVYAPFSMNDFMRAFVSRDGSVVDFEIFDGESVAEEALLFDLDGTRRFAQAAPAHWQRQQALDMAGRRWTLLFHPRPAFAAGLDATPLLILAGGALISLLLFTITAVLATTRQRAYVLAGQLNRDLQRAHDEMESKVDERTAKLRESEARTRLLLASTGEAIYGIDMEGNCTFANPACLDMIGAASEAELIGRNMHDLIHHHQTDGSPYPARDCRIYRAFRQGRGTHVDDEVLFRLDGNRFEAEYWSAPVVRDGNTIGAVVTFLDITERREGERRMADYLARIEQQNQSLAEANRARTEFLQNMRHELRTPLNAIIGFSELMVQGIPQPLPAEQQRYAQDILDAGQELLKLINEILQYTAGEAGSLALHPHPIEIKPFLAERLHGIGGSAGRKDIALALDVPEGLPRLVADPTHLRTLLDHLLDNAVKFTPEGGRVTLRAESAPEHLEIVVTDTGIGISAEDLPRLFRPFVQLDAGLARRAGGTGMGLALAQRLARLHGGEIRVASTPGQGSVFTVRLPWQTDSV